MKSLTAATLTLLALTATATAASADRLNDRRDDQLRQIEIGRETGAITWREGRRLRKEQAAIARAEYDMRADGHLSREERYELREMQSEAGANIAHQRSDGWRRPWWLPRFGY